MEGGRRTEWEMCCIYTPPSFFSMDEEAYAYLSPEVCLAFLTSKLHPQLVTLILEGVAQGTLPCPLPYGDAFLALLSSPHDTPLQVCVQALTRLSSLYCSGGGLWHPPHQSFDTPPGPH